MRPIHLNKLLFEGLQFDEVAVGHLFHTLDEWPAYAIPDGELSIAFLSDAALADIHGQFLGDTAPTDVITFPGDPEEDLAGEILVSVERAMDQAKQLGQTFPEELTLYLVHGWLHLAGENDLDEDARKRMRMAEMRVMAYLSARNAIPQFYLLGT